jgi:hypothetical protein
MIERMNSPNLSEPPGYSHVVLSSGSRLLTPAGAVPLDAEGNLVSPGDYVTQARQARDSSWRSRPSPCSSRDVHNERSVLPRRHRAARGRIFRHLSSRHTSALYEELRLAECDGAADEIISATSSHHSA